MGYVSIVNHKIDTSYQEPTQFCEWNFGGWSQRMGRKKTKNTLLPAKKHPATITTSLAISCPSVRTLCLMPGAHISQVAVFADSSEFAAARLQGDVFYGMAKRSTAALADGKVTVNHDRFNL
jgi:hypothetical protein